MQGWHRYRLTMNESEVEEHRIESGEEFLLVTAKVILMVVKVKVMKVSAASCESESGNDESFCWSLLR